MSSIPSPNDLEQLLQLATREDLIIFSIDYANDNKSFGRDLKTFLGRKYLHKKETASEYIRQMEAAFTETKDIGNRWNHYEVADWEATFNSASEILGEGRKLLDLGNADAAAAIAMEFFELICENFDENELDPYDEFTDGSYQCELAENLLYDALSSPYISPTLRENIAEKVKRLSNNDLSSYDIFDLDRFKLEVTRRTLSDEDGIKFLDKQISSHDGSYDLHVYVERKIALLRKMGKDAEADQVEKRYISLPEIRKIIVDRLVEQKDYDKAADIVKGGIEDANSEDWSWQDTRWTERLLEIYELQDNKPGQTNIARKLFIKSHGSIEYYDKLKVLIPKDEWKPWLEQLIADTSFSSNYSYGKSNLADIYVKEGEKEKLYDFVKANTKHDVNVLDHYARYTDSSHHEELLSMYTALLKKEASGQANVKMYPRIAASMECMQKLDGGKQAAHKLAVFFREEYRRRSSMMAAISRF